MPSKTKAQHNLMAMVANDPKAAKRTGIPQSVGQDFMEADKGKKFGGGGPRTREDSQKLNRPKTRHGAAAFFAEGGDMATKKLFGGKETYSEELKEAKAIKSGKITPAQYARGEKSEMKPKKMARGGGIEVKGKTKGKMVAMKKGGRCG